jgi:hypothetical protein
VLDVDANGDADALTDGLLVMRWRLGVTGQVLIDGAVAGDCTRCTAQDIEDHLGAHLEALDIDVDGETDALTDGLLAMRWLFGFRGGELIDGAVDTVECDRCTAPEIEAYLGGLR